MAVEARHLNIFLPQTLGSRDLAVNNVQNYGHVSNIPPPVYGTTMTTDANNFPTKNIDVKSESGVTTYVADNRRKRQRDDSTIHGSVNTSLLGDELAFQLNQQQLDIDRFIAQHTERLRIEIEGRRKQMAQVLANHLKKKLKSKEEELARIGRLNLALEERVKSLAVENQMWRDLAQTNEDTANALRRNLEQVLAERHRHDERSYCGSNYEDEAARGGASRLCRGCEREEPCVLLLPCRHLCVCTACGSSTHACPVCRSIKTASVHVNVN